MKKLIKRLRCRKGESLLEALISILIFTMASLAMFAMFGSANDINATVRDYTKDVAAQMVKVEKAEGTPVIGEMSVFIPRKSATDPISKFPIQIFGSTESGKLHGYFK